jgi:hypothetical protein
MPQTRSDINLWGYDKDADAQVSNTIKVEYNEAEISSLT